MTLKWEEVVIDCKDAPALGRWWADALGWDIVDEDEAGLEIRNPDRSSPTLFFGNVPEPKTVKDRLHLDFVPDDQQVEVDRLISLGATRVDIGQTGEERWVVLADPEGNEFCILAARH
ncbi:VOC family protein [Parafrigoribacterium soli]|uniref:VOC family protein n=1 Tax=Parafrigoribacterium soli TaxID=3144663 RepID=UPI0032EE632D